MERVSYNHNPFVKSASERDSGLEIRFQDYNRRYFSGRLKHHKVFKSSKSRFFGHLTAGFCDTQKKEIYIRAGLSDNTTFQTLVHEMAHAKLAKVQGHDRTFIAELSRLRKLGAKLSSGDLDLNPKSNYFPALNRKNVRRSILDALLENVPRKLIKPYLESEFSLPYSEIRKVADIDLILRESGSDR